MQYFKAVNGMEYVTQEDCVRYGGGCVGEIDHKPAIIKSIEQIPVATDLVSNANDSEKKEVTEGRDDVSTKTLTELQAIAKEKGVPNWWLFKENTLIKKIQSL